jgi:hypothetical protein
MGETHTPGPWATRFVYRMIRAARETKGLLVAADPANDWGDARLMAASPDMLHALSEMIACMEVNDIEHEICPPCVKLARAAIRKATEDA